MSEKESPKIKGNLLMDLHKVSQYLHESIWAYHLIAHRTHPDLDFLTKEQIDGLTDIYCVLIKVYGDHKNLLETIRKNPYK